MCTLLIKEANIVYHDNIDVILNSVNEIPLK